MPAPDDDRHSALLTAALLLCARRDSQAELAADYRFHAKRERAAAPAFRPKHYS
jgi:hypothetical protein